MNAMILMILRLERDLELASEYRLARRQNHLETFKPVLRPAKAARKKSADAPRASAACSDSAGNDPGRPH